MLTKDICIKCDEKHWEELKVKRKWMRDDEISWNNGSVWCSIQSDKRMKGKVESSYLKITDRPPIECPYRLEHILYNS